MGQGLQDVNIKRLMMTMMVTFHEYSTLSFTRLLTAISYNNPGREGFIIPTSDEERDSRGCVPADPRDPHGEATVGAVYTLGRGAR